MIEAKVTKVETVKIKMDVEAAVDVYITLNNLRADEAKSGNGVPWLTGDMYKFYNELREALGL